MENEKTIQESVNAVVLASAEDKLPLELGAVIKFNEKTLTITDKRSKVPEKGGKTLWTGNIDGEEFADKDSQQLRKMFGLLPRHREASAGKTFEHEGHLYSLDETADKMIEGACAKYTELLSCLQEFEKQYGLDAYNTPVNVTEFVNECREIIAKKVEAVCLARQVAKAEAEAKAAKEKAEKAAATKEQREKNKEIKTKFKELLIASNFDFNTALDALCKQFEIEKEAAVAIVL